MPGKLNPLPPRQAGIDALLELVYPLLDLDDLQRDFGIPGIPPHLLHLLLELDNRFLEIQYHFRHKGGIS